MALSGSRIGSPSPSSPSSPPAAAVVLVAVPANPPPKPVVAVLPLIKELLKEDVPAPKPPKDGTAGKLVEKEGGAVKLVVLNEVLEAKLLEPLKLKEVVEGAATGGIEAPNLSSEVAVVVVVAGGLNDSSVVEEGNVKEVAVDGFVAVAAVVVGGIGAKEGATPKDVCSTFVPCAGADNENNGFDNEGLSSVI
eukprot:CAMPEP_0170059814 /NCGR_PEP_ID=MMETSP0019_2-20121128/1965_1 /TAXON_ID=98059 /ORGANISM="Dinobryon sp., Strain UTEXLB2267" /LENGTH=192 /DNA_ID=CAMNT_0010265187 /DNA_START=215 /DNA_END=793 /DNA_ORIENTATION=+